MPILGSNSSSGSRPSAPVIGSATDGGIGTTASVAFTPSTYIGKGTITYTATSSPGSITATSSSSPITVTGLTTGTAYTFTVQGTTNYGVTSATSSASNSVTPATPTFFESIATFTLNTTSSGVTFSSIPATYKHLQLRTVSINSTSGNRLVQVGSSSVDTGANYNMHELYGSGASVTSGNIMTTTNTQIFYAPPDANVAAASITDILDYANTNKITVFKTLGGNDINGSSGRITLSSGSWNNTAIWDTLKVFPASGNFEAGSQFALYGIKG